MMTDRSNKRKRIPKRQSKKENPEKTEWKLKKGQSREAGNLGYTRQRKKPTTQYV